MKHYEHKTLVRDGRVASGTERLTEVEIVYENWSGLTTSEDEGYYHTVAQLLAKGYNVVYETSSRMGRRIVYLRREGLCSVPAGSPAEQGPDANPQNAD